MQSMGPMVAQVMLGGRGMARARAIAGAGVGLAGWYADKRHTSDFNLTLCPTLTLTLTVTLD